MSDKCFIEVVSGVIDVLIRILAFNSHTSRGWGGFFLFFTVLLGTFKRHSLFLLSFFLFTSFFIFSVSSRFAVPLPHK